MIDKLITYFALRAVWHCPSCEWWYDDGTCDMCGYGFPYTEDNNGLKPNEVDYCNAYIDKYKSTEGTDCV